MINHVQTFILYILKKIIVLQNALVHIEGVMYIATPPPQHPLCLYQKCRLKQEIWFVGVRKGF